MTTKGDFTVEARRDGLMLSSPEPFQTLFDATTAALDLAERLGRTSSGTTLHVTIASGAATLLDIKVIPGHPLDF